jgi:predicted O-linked N-acetylglucosamine transferase (SPINDLY family)
MQAHPVSRNQPCPCGSGRKFKHCCVDKAVSSQLSEDLTTDIDTLMGAAMALHRDKRYAEAITAYQRVLQLQPDHAQALHLLGLMAQQEGDPATAIELINRAIAIQPSAEMHYNLAVALQAQEDHKGAAQHYNTAVEIKPEYAMAWNNLGAVLQKLDYKEAAIEAYTKSRDLQPELASAHSNLGVALNLGGRAREAMVSFRKVLSLQPDSATALYGMGSSLQGQGDAQNPEAIRYYQSALKLDPCHLQAHNNLIFAMDMDPSYNTRTLLEERRRWDLVHAAPLACKQLPPTNLADPKRRLRIGYVSADFKSHSAPKVFGAMLTSYSRHDFELFAYSNMAEKSKDYVSRIFEKSVDCWRNVVDMTDDRLADQIREDQIDILVDLSGFTAGTRLLVFARRPAPIQVTAWGYATSTGMKAMDVFFVDPVIVPPDELSLYVEEVRYLPSVVSYYAPDPFPPVGPLPTDSGKGITFGSFNRLCKVTDEVWATWIDLLRTIPESRLLIKALENDRPEDRSQLEARFDQAGIAPQRVILMGGTDWYNHQAAFSQVDICLDPFPHGGGVSTLESLKMGVPVVVLRGNTLIGRLSTSIMTTLDMTDWVADTPTEYVGLAARKGRDLDALRRVRAGLRERLDASAIGDNQAYVRAVEAQYRQLWQRWCEQQQGGQLKQSAVTSSLLAA